MMKTIWEGNIDAKKVELLLKANENLKNALIAMVGYKELENYTDAKNHKEKGNI